MTPTPEPPESDAGTVAALFAVDPLGTGGIVLRGRAGPERDRFLARLRSLLPADAPWRRVPLSVSEERLLGGLDLTATLHSGRPIVERGLLAESDGGFIILPQAERLAASTAAQIVATIDTGAVRLERDGIAELLPTEFGVIACDEGLEEDEQVAAALGDRLAFSLELPEMVRGNPDEGDFTAAEIVDGRSRLRGVSVPDSILDGICRTAMALGIDSLRPALLTLAAARALAALSGREAIAAEDASKAVKLVLAPRATMIPATSPPEEASAPEPQQSSADQPQQQESADGDAESEPVEAEMPLSEMVLAAALAAIPPGTLERLRADSVKSNGVQKSGKAGAVRASLRRGRPAGVRQGTPGRGARLNVIETLRAAAPWQRLRRTKASTGASPRVQIRRDDFRIQRLVQRTETTTIFVVDASGSLALSRLAEAKGAVELLLAECYIRRDRVALIAFRGKEAELLLPPTRSLVRAKRSLASLPGGGGTPLAAALDAAAALAETIRRSGQTPVIVLMTDGRANIARDGTQGRARAEAEAIQAARALRAARFTSVLLDTSAQIRPIAGQIGKEMGATYLPLPSANSSVVAESVRKASQPVQCRS